MTHGFRVDKVRALALDLDGTLLRPDNTLSERTIRAVRGCRERGIAAIIATGRAAASAEPYRALLGADGPMVCYNGAMIVDTPSGRVASAVLLDTETAAFCNRLARERDVYFQVYLPGADAAAGQRLLTEKARPERGRYYQHTGLLAELGDIGEALAAPGLPGCVKAMFCAEPELHPGLRARIEGRYGNGLSIAQTQRTYLEIMAPGVSKGNALKRVMEDRGLARDEMIAFGDEENDLPLFAAAGFSAAPRSAKESVRKAADYLTASPAEDGVAVFLEEHFLR
jgi:Cof subfamily protein (haloacid dehalogenase superfamily)